MAEKVDRPKTDSALTVTTIRQSYLFGYLAMGLEKPENLVDLLADDLNAVNLLLPPTAEVGIKKLQRILKEAGKEEELKDTLQDTLRVDTDFGQLELDPNTGLAYSPILRQKVHLSLKPNSLLEALMRKPGEIHSQESLYVALYGIKPSAPKKTEAVSSHLNKLRTALGETRTRRLIRNYSGKGYSVGRFYPEKNSHPQENDLVKPTITNPSGEFVFDPLKGLVYLPCNEESQTEGSQTVKLTPLETRILAVLTKSQKPVTERDFGIGYKAFKAHISRLNAKVGGNLIKNRHGFGYYLD